MREHILKLPKPYFNNIALKIHLKPINKNCNFNRKSVKVELLPRQRTSSKPTNVFKRLLKKTFTI